MATIRTLLGPPGTGKTTELINRIQALLADGVRPDEIAFVSFTKGATRNAIDRACERFDLDPDAFPWFKTIHAMARAAVSDHADVMRDQDWKDFGESCSYSFSAEQFDDGAAALNFEEDGDCLRSVDQLARVMRTSLAKAIIHAGDVPAHLTPEMFEIYRSRLSAWKSDSHKIDFVDMLEQGLAAAWRPPVRFAFIDEAQDNSRIQNSLMRHWFWDSARCETVTYAGDDDQQIYGWSGAQNGALGWISRHSETNILTQSYRVPKRAHSVGQSIIRQNRMRVNKVYRPRDDEGGLFFAEDSDGGVDCLRGGESLALVRNAFVADAIRQSCLDRGRLFRSEIGKSSPLDLKHARGAFDAIMAWRNQSSATAEQLVSLLKCVPSGKGATRLLPVGAKKRSEQNKDAVPIWRAREEFGLRSLAEMAVGDQPFSVLMTLDADVRSYFDRIARVDPRLSGDWTTITSIHRAKGREAPNVLILPDQARRSQARSFASDAGREEENCVWYVGVTRTMRNLVICDPHGSRFYNLAAHTRAT